LGESDETLDCQRCGACCATYRVSFYWADGETWRTPEGMTERVAPLYSCMVGTSRASPRCIALAGTVGKVATCTIYDQRPPPCRELQPGDERGLKARARHGLSSGAA
jgi:Fe-S-cluster containining protein